MSADIAIGGPRETGQRVMQLAATHISIVGDLVARESGED